MESEAIKLCETSNAKNIAQNPLTAKAWRTSEYLDVNLSRVLSSSNIGTCREKSRIESLACAVKNNLRRGIYTDRNAKDFYVVEATLENKCMPCFQNYDYTVRKGAEKMYQASPSPISKMNY